MDSAAGGDGVGELWHGLGLDDVEFTTWPMLLGFVCGAVGVYWLLQASREFDDLVYGGGGGGSEERRNHEALLAESRHGRLVLPAAVAAALHKSDPSRKTGTSMQQRLQTFLTRRGGDGGGGGGRAGSSEPPLSPVDGSGGDVDAEASVGVGGGGGGGGGRLSLPEGVAPLLAFVNSRSGGGQGLDLARRLKRLLHASQVVDLAKAGPAAALQRYQRLARFTVLVCGGDGTVGWVLGEMDALGVRAPVAIMPLGTGNDLARVLGWGGGWEGESVADILGQLAAGHVEPLDRWGATADRGRLPLRHWTNYVSIGADAEVALRFHRHRNTSPWAYASRVVNKAWYAAHGVAAFLAQLRRAAVPADPEEEQTLCEHLTVLCDGEAVELPEDTRGVIVSNIGSYGGGATCLWPGPSCVDRSDGLVEVVAVTGVFHLTQVQLGLASGIPLARCSRVELRLARPLPMQMDGEPFHQPAGCVAVSRAGTCNMLCRTSDGVGTAIAEMAGLLEWAEESGTITHEQVWKALTEGGGVGMITPRIRSCKRIHLSLVTQASTLLAETQRRMQQKRAGSQQ